jgi:hypothetical protein
MSWSDSTKPNTSALAAMREGVTLFGSVMYPRWIDQRIITWWESERVQVGTHETRFRCCQRGERERVRCADVFVCA